MSQRWPNTSGRDPPATVPEQLMTGIGEFVRGQMVTTYCKNVAHDLEHQENPAVIQAGNEDTPSKYLLKQDCH